MPKLMIDENKWMWNHNIEIIWTLTIWRTMRKSRYDEAEGGELVLEACEVFFRYW